MEKYEELIGSKVNFEIKEKFHTGTVVKTTGSMITVELDHPIMRTSRCGWDPSKVVEREISLVHIKWTEIESVSGKGENLGNDLGIASSDVNYTVKDHSSASTEYGWFWKESFNNPDTFKGLYNNTFKGLCVKDVPI